MAKEAKDAAKSNDPIAGSILAEANPFADQDINMPPLDV
jgi:hypothetical protein